MKYGTDFTERLPSQKIQTATLSSKEALKLYDNLQRDGVRRHSIPVILAALKACSASRDIETGMKIHADMVANRCDSNIYVLNSLLDLYSKCGSMTDVQRVFDKMPCHTVVSWNTLIKGYAQSGQGSLALDLFVRMQREESLRPNSRTFVAAITACTSLLAAEEDIETARIKFLEKGMALHCQAARDGHDLDMYVASSLVDFYAKCGSMVDARRVFDKIKTRDVVSWTALIAGYVQSGKSRLALELFQRMQEDGCKPNALTYGASLKACAQLAAEAEEKDGISSRESKVVYLERGRELHFRLARCGFEADAFVASSLIDMYSNCGSIDEARAVFERMKTRDVVAWNTIIMGYAQSGDGEAALKLFSWMQREEPRVVPNARTFVAVISACSAAASTEQGRNHDGRGKLVKAKTLDRGAAIHGQARESNCCGDIFVANSLIDMYSKCGSVIEARRVFDGMQHRNVVSWTSIILGYADDDQPEVALELFFSAFGQKGGGLQPSAQTFVAALKACGRLAELQTGRQLHDRIREAEMENNPMLVCSLIGFYGKCGDTASAQGVFDSTKKRDAAVWSALIAAYSYQGNAAAALDLLARMREQKVAPDAVTLVSVLNACSHAGLVDAGLEIFRELGASATVEQCTCVIDLLSRANRLEEAEAVAERMSTRTGPSSVVWMTLLAGCSKWKKLEVAKRAFARLLEMDPGYFDRSGAFVAMANVYSSVGMQRESDQLMRREEKSMQR